MVVHPTVLFASACALGALVGAGVGLALPVAQMRSPPPRQGAVRESTTQVVGSARRSSEPSSCSGAIAGAEGALARLEAQRDALSLNERLLRSQLAIIGGLPSPWPEELPPDWTEAAVRARLAASDAALDSLEVLEVDCSEYPCLALVLAEDPDRPGDGATVSDISEIVDDWPGTQAMTSGMIMEPRRRAFGVVTLSEGAEPEQVRLRAGVRQARAIKALRERLIRDEVP